MYCSYPETVSLVSLKQLINLHIFFSLFRRSFVPNSRTWSEPVKLHKLFFFTNCRPCVRIITPSCSKQHHFAAHTDWDICVDVFILPLKRTNKKIFIKELKIFGFSFYSKVTGIHTVAFSFLFYLCCNNITKRKAHTYSHLIHTHKN